MLAGVTRSADHDGRGTEGKGWELRPAIRACSRPYLVLPARFTVAPAEVLVEFRLAVDQRDAGANNRLATGTDHAHAECHGRAGLERHRLSLRQSVCRHREYAILDRFTVALRDHDDAIGASRTDTRQHKAAVRRRKAHPHAAVSGEEPLGSFTRLPILWKRERDAEIADRLTLAIDDSAFERTCVLKDDSIVCVSVQLLIPQRSEPCLVEIEAVMLIHPEHLEFTIGPGADVLVPGVDR